MENLIKTVETFLAYSEEKLEELADKNRALKTEREQSDKIPQRTIGREQSRIVS